jgi:hypothetical protein
MPVFSRYNPRQAGRVLQQAHPDVHSYPWVPLTTTTRTDTQWGGRGRTFRVQPNERGKTFSGGLGGGATGEANLAPAMGSSCGGGCGCKGCDGIPPQGVNKNP